ncbi:MAG: hypothetical protein Q8M23_09880 [Bacteroidales bacterium]|nr:hypothetical protein [Bacteroidales bacterium]
MNISKFLQCCMLVAVMQCSPNLSHAQKRQIPQIADTCRIDVFIGLNFSSIGRALMSGRISDIVIHSQNQNTWYIAVGSGGVWKTENSGTTWQPLFDQQGSYSIGCITLDPSNPDRI